MNKLLFFLVILLLPIDLFADLFFDAILTTKDGKVFEGMMYSTAAAYPDSIQGEYEGYTLQLSLLIVKEIEIIDNQTAIVTTFLGNKKYKLKKFNTNINEYIDIDVGRVFFRFKDVKNIKLWVKLRKCPKCERLMSEEWTHCPFDGTKLRKREEKIEWERPTIWWEWW